MVDEGLQVVVRTPEGCVFDERIRSLRAPSDTGQVGLRPGSEPTALLVEPGLVLAEAEGGLRFVATAGGLLRCDGRTAVILTPLAVVGRSAEAVRAELDREMGASRQDLELRAVLQQLETGILQELRRSSPDARGAGLD